MNKLLRMSMSSEKLVKLAIKTIAKKHDLEYSDLKETVKKIIKSSKKYDEGLLGIMEEMLDMGNIGSEEELNDFDTTTLKIYCKIKELDDSGSEKHLRARVWKNIESEFELESEDESEDESVDSESDHEEEIIKKKTKAVIA